MLGTTNPPILLITGNMASGKSTVAQALAERLPKSVHLRGDIFRRMIVNGQAEMGVHLSVDAAQQLQLRYELAVTCAKRYVQAGFVVVYQDIVIGPMLVEVMATFSPYQSLTVVLCPRAEVVAARERTRHKTGYVNEADIAAFDQILRTETPRVGYWLDTSDLTVPATVERIIAHFQLETL